MTAAPSPAKQQGRWRMPVFCLGFRARARAVWHL